MLEIIRYTPENKILWDELVDSSRNGTFLFYRDYMDYHSDRFKDCSFLVFRKGKIEAILPGNIDETTFFSHQGLTYGGLITSSKIVTIDVLEIFNLINKELQSNGISEVIYKPVPYIYHTLPAQEDIYALFKLKAVKIGCNISSTIFQNNKIKFIESRKSGIRKSIKNGVIIHESDDFMAMWKMLQENLQEKHNIKPAHTETEIKLLYNRFPENIKLYLAEAHDEIVAGSLLYVMKNIVHVQYICASEIGKEIGALDFLFDKLINELFVDIPVFDFGQSTEQMGNILNENLIFQKEGFGSRGVVYEIYKYQI